MAAQSFIYRYVRALLLESGLVFAVALVAIVLLPLMPAMAKENVGGLFVDPVWGNDSNPGSEAEPLKTLTKAIEAAPANTIIQLSPGLYSAESGEIFPLMMKSGVTIRGQVSDRGQSILIRGSGIFLSRTFAKQKVTFVGTGRSGLQGVTVSNPEEQGYGVWVESSSPVISDNTFTGSGHDGVSVVGSSAPVLKNNYFYENGANGITIYGNSQPEVRENIFESTGFGINVAQNAAPKIIGNRITKNKDGIVVQGNAKPVIRNNVIDNNERDGLVTISQSQPDLGFQGDPGGNSFSANGQFDINAKTSSNRISAAGNQFAAFSGQVDDRAVKPPETVAFLTPEQPTVPTQTVARPLLQTPDQTPAAGVISPGISLPPMTVFPTVAVKAGPTAVMRDTPKNLIIATGNSRLSNQPKPQMSRAANLGTIALGAPPLSSPAPLATRPSIAIPIPVPAPERPVVPPMVPSINAPPLAQLSPTAAQTLARLPMAGPPVLDSATNFVPNSVGRTIQPGLSNGDLLPVPKDSIPVGDTGGEPAAPWLSRGGLALGGQVGGPPAPPLAANLAALKYRVVVPGLDPGQVSQVQSLVPGAFSTVVRGQIVLQAGAFSDRTKAEALHQLLASQGVMAALEEY